MIREIARIKGVKVFFYGLDQNELPVIGFTDARLRAPEPFAILRSHRPKTVTEVAYPVRWFTDQEIATIEPETHELLTTLLRGVVHEN